MNIAAVNGSPRGEKSSSMEIVSLIRSMVPSLAQWHIVSQIKELRDTAGMNSNMSQLFMCDTLLVSFPLYIDSLPASLVCYLERYEEGFRRQAENSGGNRSQRVFAVSNCGFYEGVQNRTALEIMENFCVSAGLEWCGGAGIGTGEMVRGLSSVPGKAFIKKPVTAALETVASAMASPGGKIRENIFTQHNIPWLLYKLAGEYGWRRELRKNRLKRGDIDARPLGSANHGPGAER